MTARTLLSIFLVTAFIIPAFSQAPKITGFSPTNGPVNTAVVISGSGFSATAASNIVYFGAVRATVTAATATQLTVTAPAGTSYQPLSVTVNGRIGYASKPFVITFPGSLPLSQASFKPYVKFDFPLQAFDVNDMDGDGKADLLISDGTLAVVKNNAGTGLFNQNSFASPYELKINPSAGKVLTVDVDGDGEKDLLQSGSADATLQIFLHIGAPGTISTSSFGPLITLPLANAAHDFSYADFDSDGLIDIVATTSDFSSANYVALFQNTSTPGSISFAPRVDIPATVGQGNIAVGDIDGDGMPDLVGSNDNRLLSVFRNKMTGPGALTMATFETPFDLYSNDYPQSMVVGDVDQDGKNDIIISSQELVLHHNIGTPGTLSAASFDTPVQLLTSGHIAFGDLNGDGKPDLALANAGDFSNIYVLINTSTPGTITTSSFSDPVNFAVGYEYRGLNPSEVSINDLDNDGKSDLIIVNSKVPSLSVLRNTFGLPPVAPNIASFTPLSGTPGSTVTITGTNFSATPADNIVFFGATRATVTAANGTSLSVTVPFGGTVDYITVTTHTRTAFAGRQFVPILTGTPGDNIAFQDPIDLATDMNSGYITIKDMDSDGRADIIDRSYVSGVGPAVHLHKNSGQNTTAVFDDPYTTSNAGFNYGVIDADGDGIPDLFGQDNDQGDGSLIFVSFGTGDITRFGINPYLYEGGIPDPGNFAVADLDGDGQPDVGSTEANTGGPIEIYGNVNGGFPFENTQYNSLDPSSNFLAFADIDGDGKPDAILSQPTGGTISILQNTSVTGTISFDSPITFATDATPGMVATGDLDGDGKIDIITVNGNSVSILRNLMQSPGAISSSSLAQHFELEASAPTWAATGDLNGDGKLDLGVANSDNTISIFRNMGSSGALSSDSFAGKVSIATGKNPSGLAFGDLNNDGAMDMVVTNGGETSLFVYINALGPAPVDQELEVYNGVSPNGDGKNDHWHIRNINILTETKTNHVSIYNRWGDLVYETDNYDNSTAVFTGRSTSGNDLPTGTYFYKISFTSDRKSQTGFISLKR